MTLDDGFDATGYCIRMSERNVERLVRKYVDKRDDKLIDIVERCVRRGYDYDRMKERISEHIRDSTTRKRLVEALSNAFPQFAYKSKHKFEEKKIGGVKESGGGRNNDEPQPPTRKDKKAKTELDYLSTPSTMSTPVQAPSQSILIAPKLASLPHKIEPKTEDITEEELRSKELMYQAQMAIEERKRQLNLTAKPGIVAQTVISKASKLNVKEASMFMNYSIEKINRVKELKEKLARSTALPQLATKQLEKAKPEADSKIVEYLDPRISLKSAQRKPRSIVFHEKGEYESLAHRERAKARLAMLQTEISDIAKRTGMSSSVKLAMLTQSSTSTAIEIPEVEWWDQIVLGGQNYDSIPDQSIDVDERYKDSITNLVEHPIQLKPPDEPLHAQYLKVYLTSKERKKIRRQNRKEAQKEQTEKIRLGLAKAPEPKVKLSNLMRVLGSSELIEDPTKMEMFVRKQIQQRQRKHLYENQQRKLTKEQKINKLVNKIKEDTSLSVYVALYKVKSLLHPAKKFKVEMNAKQLQMTGIILIHANINLVIVEGGPKQQKNFKNLMLNRIKWADEVIGQKKDVEDKDAPGERNECTLIWEGVIKRRNFTDLKCMSATIEKQAREILDKYNVAHYWDLAYSTSLLKDDND